MESYNDAATLALNAGRIVAKDQGKRHENSYWIASGAM